MELSGVRILWLLMACGSIIQIATAQSRVSYTTPTNDYDSNSGSDSDSESGEDSTEFSNEDSGSTEEVQTERISTAAGLRLPTQQHEEQKAEIKKLLGQQLLSSTVKTIGRQLIAPNYSTKRPLISQRLSAPVTASPTQASNVASSTQSLLRRPAIRQPSTPESASQQTTLRPTSRPRGPFFRLSTPIALTTPQPQAELEQSTLFFAADSASSTTPAAVLADTVAPYQRQYEYSPYDISTTTKRPQKPRPRNENGDYADYAEEDEDAEEDDLDYNPWRDNFYDQFEDGTYVFGYSLPHGQRRYERSYHTEDGLVVEGFYTELRQVGDFKKYELRCYRAGIYGHQQTAVKYLRRPPVVQRDVEPDVDCLHGHEEHHDD